jgi:hypothetical protein
VVGVVVLVDGTHYCLVSVTVYLLKQVVPCFSTCISAVLQHLLGSVAMARHANHSRRTAVAMREMGKFVARQLKLMDWVGRHQYYRTVTSATRPGGPGFADQLKSIMSPDELLYGLLTGSAAKGVIIAKDKPGKRQLKLTDIGFRRRPRRQTLLGEYGILSDIVR